VDGNGKGSTNARTRRITVLIAADGANVFRMAADGDKVTVDLDAKLVARTRDELGGGGETDAAVVERALNAYLLGRLLDVTQAKSELSDDDADRLAVEEVRAARRERSSAA
jgi:hypothetical protein